MSTLASGWRSEQTTLAPSLANASAMARLTTAELPVTIANLSARWPGCDLIAVTMFPEFMNCGLNILWLSKAEMNYMRGLEGMMALDTDSDAWLRSVCECWQDMRKETGAG
jgi:hypothetical protein